MVRTRGQEMRRLQRKLIPVNLLVCVLCIVSAVTLFFMPLLKLDLGKMVGNEDVQKYVLDQVDKMGGTGSSGGSDSGSTEGGSAALSIDVNAIVKEVIKPILNGVNGTIIISPMEMTKLAFNESPGDMLVSTYFTGEKGLVTQLVTSLTATIKNLGDNDELTGAIEDAVVATVADTLKQSLPEEYKNVVNEQELQDTLKKLDEVESEQAAVDTITNFMDDIAKNNESVAALSEEDKKSLESSVREMYQEVVTETKDDQGNDNFSMEALICVKASKGLNESLGEGGLGSLIGGAIGSDDGSGSSGESSVAAVRNILTEGAAAGSEGGSGESSGESGSTGSSGESGSTENTETPKGEIYTSYGELFGSLITDEQTDAMVNELTSTIDNEMGDLKQTINEQKTIFMIIWGVLIFFVALWVILFLFAFFHMLAKNKRFTMWYVKLLAWIPCLFWLAPIVGKLLITKGVISGLDAATIPLATAAFAGVSSMTWISGLCLLLLWVISIFWAFPIKRKIRKLKKRAREEEY